MRSKPLAPREAYNLVARNYDEWTWQRFWRMAEAPIVTRELLRSRSRKFLDVGCGTGPYLRRLAPMGLNGIGLDISEEMLGEARRRGGNLHALVQGDARFLPFKPRSFEAVLMARVLSHIGELDIALSEVARVLRSGGVFVLTDVHPNHAYENTRIPLENTKISIETFKHSIDDIMRMAMETNKLRSTNLEFVRKSTITPEWANLVGVPNDPRDPPIGYVASFVRI